MKRPRTIVVTVIACMIVAMVLAVILLGAGAQKAGVSKLEVELPDGYSISSYAAYQDTLVLCCYLGGYIGSPQFALLTYKHGDAEFGIHPLSLTTVPYEAQRTSLQVVNGTLYFFCTSIRSAGEYNVYDSHLWKVNTGDWTLQDRSILNLPRLLAPGVEVSDGKDLYIIGGSDSNPNPPYWPFHANDTILRVNVDTGASQVVATIPGASSMHALFAGDDLVFFNRSGDPSGGAEVNYGSSMDWNSAVIYDLESGELLTPEDLSPLNSPGYLPATDGTAVYFFNPWLYNSTSYSWNYTHQIWRMDQSGALTKADLVLPDDVQWVLPIRVGSGFFLFSFSQDDTTCWWCTL